LIGVILGFILPLFACLGLFFALVVGIGTLGGQATSGAPSIPIHLSGPLTGPAIAIIEVNGPIVSGRLPAYSSSGIAASEDIIQTIRLSSQDSDVKAILLKVNSPGGSVVASDQIYQELKNTQEPIVVLMGETAASGGYYVSMAGDRIIANPNTLLGSIGVISTIPNAEELFKKIGIEFNVIISGEEKDFGSLYRDMTQEEVDYWQGVIDETYDGFVNIVAEGRGLPVSKVRELADGKVYTGRQALELGLIDDLGYENDAINEAAKLGLIGGEPRIIRYTSNTGFLSLLTGFSKVPQGTIPVDLIERFLAPKVEFRWVP